MRTRPSIAALLFATAACAPPQPEPVIVIGGAAPPSPPVAHTALSRPLPPKSQEQPPAPPHPPRVTHAAPPPPASPLPGGTPLDVARDLRSHRLNPRPVPLVVTELQGLESLLASMPATSPDRPALLRRLAEIYIELSSLPAQQNKAATIAQAARRSAIKHYEALVNLYPQWCAAPNTNVPAKSTGCVDEALYYLGLERERNGDPAGARRAYLALIQAWPQSQLVPSAYLAFGELFLSDAVTDPTKLPLAEQSYLEVLKYPPPGNAVYGYAQYQLARVHLERQDQQRAIQDLRKALAWAQKYRNAAGAADLESAAQRDLRALGVP